MEEECKGCNNFSMCNKCMNGEQWAFIEEKGSKELENKIQDFFDRWMKDSEYNQAVMPNFCCASLEDCKNIARHFAKWQKEQFEKNRLKHCNSITIEQSELEQGFIDQHIDKHQRMPTFLDAIEYGMQLMKEPASEDLDEAAKQYSFHQTYSGDMEYYAENEIKAFKAGAQWQKQQDQEHPDKESFAKRLKLEKEEWEDEYRQQMMKEAVKATVMHYYSQSKEGFNGRVIFCSDSLDYLKTGDKVNIKVFKED